MSRAGLAAVLLAGAAAVVLWQWSAGLPFFSDTWNHLQAADSRGSVWASLDPALAPLRPLQHLYFGLLVTFGMDTPGAARLLPCALHGANAALLHGLVRRLGGSPAAGLVALGIFLCYPAVQSIVWIAAIGWPGRLFAMLCFLHLALRHRHRPGWPTGAGQLLMIVLGLGFHQAAFALPLALVLLLAGVDGGTVTAFRGALHRILHDRWWMLCGAMVAGYLVYLLLFREQRTHAFQAGAVPANTARAIVALLPSVLRTPAAEAGPIGEAALALAAIWGWAFVLVRSRGPVRALLLIAAVELAVPALTTGFLRRYTYVPAAFAAGALALSMDRSARPTAGWLLGALLLLGWGFDQTRDLKDLEAAGALARSTVRDLLQREQALGSDRSILLVNAPWFAGSEGDLNLFNYGLLAALRRAGSTVDWIPVRTTPGWFTTDFRRITETELLQLEREHAGRVVRLR